MTEYFRITGLNDIVFDGIPANRNYDLDGIPTMSRPLSKADVIKQLDSLPREIRGHALNRGMSTIVIPFKVTGFNPGFDHSDLEDKLHDIHETLEDAKLYIATQGGRGTRTEFRFQLDNASQSSYKTVYWGEVDERDARKVFEGGLAGDCPMMEGLRLVLYFEPYWRPLAATTLGPNEIYCPSFEEDGDGNGRADDWVAGGAVLAMESTIVLHGCYSQKVTTNGAWQGPWSTQAAAPAAPANDAVGYAWVCRPAPGCDIAVIINDATAAAVRATGLLSTGGWPTAIGKSGQTWYRVAAIATNNIVPGNLHELRITSADAIVTDWYADKTFLKFDTTTIPDEWADHWKVYNHYDTTEAAVDPLHEGHINYYDVDDLKGDVDARLMMRVEFEKIADEDYARHLIVGRRSRADVGCAHWWLEAEDSAPATNWTDLALARCSAGGCVTDNANVTGFVQWTIWAGSPSWPNIAATLGHYDVYAAVYTDDPANTQYRLSYGTTPGYSYNQWRKQSLTSKWELISLGSIRVDPVTRAGVPCLDFTIQVEYQKDAIDTARLDFIWLISQDEPEMRLQFPAVIATARRLNVSESWTVDRTADFDMEGHEDLPATSEWIEWIALLGNAMTLAPQRENRLYFVCETYDDPDDIYEAHRIAGPANALEMVINIDYLPQFVSPLE